MTLRNGPQRVAKFQTVTDPQHTSVWEHSLGVLDRPGSS